MSDEKAGEDKRKIFVVTGKSIKDTGLVSFKFMVGKGVPFRKFMDFASHFGHLQLRKKGANEINPFKLMRGEPGAIGDDGVKKWEITIFKTGKGFVMSCGAEEKIGEIIEPGLKSMIQEFPSCVILMERNLFERFQSTCSAFPDIELDWHHCEIEVATS